MSIELLAETIRAFDTLLHFSTAFHPVTDGKLEWTIQNLEDILRASALHFKKVWDERLALIEFPYSNSYHSTIGMTSYEALYRRKRRTLLYWKDVDESLTIGLDLIQATTMKVRVIQEWMRAA